VIQRVEKFFRRMAAFLITLYQWVCSPLLPPACRFTPSCSEYAKQAILTRGIVSGVWLGFRRLLRCHPFHQGGYDPVP
jgi:putative membrane protein insertion efficiency factor